LVQRLQESFLGSPSNMAAPAYATVHIPLDPGMLGSLSRRGHARLRTLQSQTPEVRLSLDLARGVLLLTGPGHRMDDLRQQIAGLLGRPKKVPLALWAELMRTRKSNDGLIARLQQFSGSRIHIERDKYELCIYGSDEQFSVVNGLLDHVAKDCIEERLWLDTSQIGEQKLNELPELAEACGIAIHMKGNEMIVLGMRDAVTHFCEKGFLKTLCVNNLLDDELDGLRRTHDELPEMGMLMRAQQAALGSARLPSEGLLNSSIWGRQPIAESQASCQMSTERSRLTVDLPNVSMLMHKLQTAQGSARQPSESSLNSSRWSRQPTAEGQASCQMSSGQGVITRQHTAEGPEPCHTSVSAAATSDPPQRLFDEQYFGPWIRKTVSSTASSASSRVAPTVTPSSSFVQGQSCSFCGNGVSKDANFCFFCGQLVRATPSIEAALEAASIAQTPPQQYCTLSEEPPMQATRLPPVMTRLSV